MLFRVTFALFVLFNTLPAPSFATGKGTAARSEVTVVGPTDDTAPFIAVRPVAAPMQPEGTPMTTTGTVPQPEPEAQQGTAMVPQPASEEPQMQGEMTTGIPESGRVRMMEPRTMERMMERMDLTTNERVMLRGIFTRMRERMRGRRLHRRAITLVQTTGTMERPRVTAPTPETPRVEPRPVTEPEQSTVEEPMIEQSMTEVTTAVDEPTIEQPMTTPETEEVTPAASGMSVRGARFNTAVGDIDISSEMFGARQGERTIPQTAVRDADFNTFVGRLRAHSTELPRRMEPQWEGEWMPRGRFEWMPRRRFEWMPRRRFEWMPHHTRRFVGRFE